MLEACVCGLLKLKSVEGLYAENRKIKCPRIEFLLHHSYGEVLLTFFLLNKESRASQCRIGQLFNAYFDSVTRADPGWSFRESWVESKVGIRDREIYL